VNPTVDNFLVFWIGILFQIYLLVDADPDWHQHDAGSHADPTPSFTHVGKPDFLYFE
jgi:hypothetical protein